jgi:sialic acid synthase SpsE
VFSLDGVEYLEKVVKPKLYKVASADANWPELLDCIERTGKTYLVSDGCFDVGSRRRMVPMRCVSEYPAEERDYFFADVPSLIWGVSDHTKTGFPSVIGAAVGAWVVELHFKLERTNPLDDVHSHDPDSFRSVVRQVRNAAAMAFHDRPGPITARWIRRAHYARAMGKGDVLRRGDLVMLRGPLGVYPNEVEQMIGKRMRVDRGEGQWVMHGDVEE